MQSARPDCGNRAGVHEGAAYTPGWNNGVVGAACYGIKPPQGTPNIQPWNGNLWSLSSGGLCSSVDIAANALQYEACL